MNILGKLDMNMASMVMAILLAAILLRGILNFIFTKQVIPKNEKYKLLEEAAATDAAGFEATMKEAKQDPKYKMLVWVIIFIELFAIYFAVGGLKGALQLDYSRSKDINLDLLVSTTLPVVAIGTGLLYLRQYKLLFNERIPIVLMVILFLITLTSFLRVLFKIAM